MPRIDPFQLLKCLSVLLGPSGGIKSKEEVHRLATLMTKFSKKLVSKCIYIQILKTTDTELLSQFMDAGGWSLIHMWLTDGIVAKNWALIQELLELLHLCPVKIDRLKSNNCPKLIKGLSKEVTHQGVRLLAGRLVEQWLKIVKGEAAPNSVPAHIIGNMHATSDSMDHPENQYNAVSSLRNDIVGGCIDERIEQNHDTGVNNYSSSIESGRPTVPTIQPQIVNNTIASGANSAQQVGKSSYVLVTSNSTPAPFPVCKITIRDGNEVLVKVETDASNINSVLKGKSSRVMNGEAQDDETTESNDAEDDCAVNDNSSEVNQHTTVNSKDSANGQVNSKTSKDEKNIKDTVSSDTNKSSDKENRDSHKADDKKSGSGSNGSLEKKSESNRSSKSSSSSKHSSSSHRSSSHRSSSSSHRSGSGSSKSSSSSRDKSSRDKDRHHHSSSSSSKHSSSSSKSKTDRDKEKEKLKKDQAEKDKATLEKVQSQALGVKFGKIPKKKPEDEKAESSLRKTSTESRDSSKENKDKAETKKSLPATILEKKNISMSIENRKNSQDAARPKTVKTFNSKFRSTGLEEEVKPPPPRSAAKKPLVSPVEKKIMPLAKPALPSLKRSSPLRETSVPSDKRAKLSLEPPISSPTEEKKGAIKLIAPKPKPMVLQESDMFMDALTASTKAKEPRKRKRRTSISKDGSSDSKKSEHANADGGHESPSQNPSSPPSADERSPLVVKPNFKFYQDTLETDEDKEDKDKLDERIKKEKSEETDQDKGEGEENDDYEACLRQVAKSEAAGLPVKNELKQSEDDAEEAKESDSAETEDATSESAENSKKDRTPSPISEIRYLDGLRSVLLLQKRKGPKKNLKWKTDLESIRYFELDETERVNVTKTFTDMKQMEKQGEREAFQARKLSTEDTMEEKTRWMVLIPIDLRPALVEPGKDSREKDIQYAREKGILQALYFNRSMIPDSPAEPDEERHHGITDPKVIPLEDLTGNKDSEKDFTGVPWPEPKAQLQPQMPIMQPPGYHFPGGFPHNQPPMLPPMGPPGPQGPMGPMPPMQQGPMMGPMNPMGPDMGVPMNAPNMSGGGGWRTGDGKVVVPDVGPMNPMQPPMPNMPGGFPPSGMDGGPMMPPGMMGPPMFNQPDGFGMMGPDDMGYGNFQGPPGPGMFGPGPNFQGPPRGGGPMHGNRGRGAGPGWFRGGAVAGGPMRGGVGNGGGWRGGWRGNGKQPPICRQFTKNGFCRIGDKCQYLHPGVNCPPF